MAEKVFTVTLNPSLDKTVVIDKLVPYGLHRVLRTETDPGGKGINVARVLHSFGVEVVVTGFIAGSTGKMLRDFLEQERIHSDFVEIAGETRTNVKIFDRNVRKTTELNESGSTVTAQDLAEFEARFRSLCRDARVAVLSGSLPPGAPADTYAHFIDIAKAAGVRAILDADGDALRAGIESVPYAVKPNIHELETLAGRALKTPYEVLEVGRKLIRKGIGLVIVSMGPDGAVVLDAENAYKVDSWDVFVNGATGAGDSMVGALADALLRGADLAEIARVTTVAGTITASKPGTRLCTKREVMETLDLVTLHPLAAGGMPA